MDEWTNETWYIHTMEYDSVINRNEALTPATVWMNLKNAVLSERSQTHKDCVLYDPIYLKCPEQVNS